MNRKLWIPTFLFLIAGLSFGYGQETKSQWRPLLTESLDGWEVYTGVPHQSVTVPGFPKSTSEDSRSGKAIGLGDPMEIFQIKMVDDQPVLHITGQIYAGLVTQKSYENYHLSLEYKWGEKKWEPRLYQKRDSGVLIHSNGEHGAFWNVWKKSLECQIQESDTGDFIAIAGTSALIEVDSEDSQNPKYQPDANLSPVGSGSQAWGCRHQGDFEKSNDWNRVDILTVGDKVIFAVNGHVVMRLNNTRSGNQKTGTALTSGQIQIQSEGAEVDYRNIRMKSITQLPVGDTIDLDD